MKKLLLLSVLCLGGCASRTIDLEGYGRYHSTMNSELENFELIIDKPDGTHVYVKIGKSVSDPAMTLEAQAELLKAIVPSIIEGILKGLVP